MTTNSQVPIIGQQILSNESARLQIDNSILASLIALSQSLGQLQGEIAVLKASGVNMQDVQNEVENLNKIVITGDSNLESLVHQIRMFKNSVEDIKLRLKTTEDAIDTIEDEKTQSELETKKISVQNTWQVVLLIVGALITGVFAWLGIK